MHLFLNYEKTNNMRKTKQIFGLFIMKMAGLIPPKSAATGLLIGIAAMLTTTTNSCESQVMCYDPAPPDTIPQDTLDSTRLIQSTDTITRLNEERKN